ncbi:MAG: BNR repeat-containing protein, partial [Planctomycetota bacterium]
ILAATLAAPAQTSAGVIAQKSPPTAPWQVAEMLDIAPVWSGHRVRFALLTQGGRQYAAYYDAERRMTVVARPLCSTTWTRQVLPTSVGWDSHNYITMALDNDGHLHVSGNMHCVPLIYFRTTRPGDITSLEQIPAMVGRNEKSCTYPRFLTGLQGELLFTYRDGRSGNGQQYFNVYDLKTRTWRRLFEEPLFAGLGEMSAYYQGPLRDAEGIYHLAWVWRDTADCATNHDLSYARSRDLVHWKTADSQPLPLPITPESPTVVDPVPSGGGLLNSAVKMSFDASGRPVLSYLKFDPQGNTQIYSARREGDQWQIRQTSDWDYRWAPSGGGSIRSEIGFSAVEAQPDGSLLQSYSHIKYGGGHWLLDEATLKPIGRGQREVIVPRSLYKLESKYPGMTVEIAADLAGGRDGSREAGSTGIAAGSPEPAERFFLRWETLPSNRDRPREGDPPPPTMLRLIRVSTGTAP